MATARKKIQLPEQLVIGHAKFSVEVNSVECEALGSLGHTQADHRRIVIRDDIPLDKMREVMLHEALHAVIATAPAIDLANDQEEQMVRFLTGPLLYLLKENPQFVQYIIQE